MLKLSLKIAMTFKLSLEISTMEAVVHLRVVKFNSVEKFNNVEIVIENFSNAEVV